MRSCPDARRWVTERAAGIVRLLMDCEALYEDVEGALAQDDLDYAAYSARDLLVRTLSVASLRAGGDVHFEDAQTTFDPLAGVSADQLEKARRLAVEAVGNDALGPEWLSRLRELVADVESGLEIGEPLPRIRTADGMFPALAVARDWVDACAELGGPVIAIMPGGG